MGSLPLAESRLCALFTESILYGFYMITYAFTVQILFFSHYRLKRFRELNVAVVSGTTTLFVVITGNICLSFYRSIRAFIFSSSFPNGPMLEYSNVSGWLNVAETSFILIGTIAGDWILIHRCWILWNRSWKWISVSSFLWLGCLFCTIRIIALEALFKGQGVFNSDDILPYGTSFWAASILINISTTFLTIYRIYLMEEANKKSGLQPPVEGGEFPQSTLHYIICITVESGLLNTLSAIGTLVTYVTQSSSVYIMTAIELPIVGIACNLIILRANRRTKRLMKLKMKKNLERGSTLYHLGATDTIPYTTGSVERITADTGDIYSTSTNFGDQSDTRGRIPELPYP